ncbi:uncharacterized protein LOC130630190 [Hydractinia symbiolongicarpus]|uniref:uncharacterized protein LOC130630190 n=1 Tax=Hydractinia symbiolongicarpus TaxID=13093 RepID=UPI00254E290B|nr:uncharacterized protein LOC130630190 [Hydractinia symbiolongicarpus]
MNTEVPVVLIDGDITQSVDVADTVQYDRLDIGHYVNKIDALNDHEKHKLLNKVWKPTQTHNFEKDIKTNRKFKYAWFESFPWLVYSDLLKGAFCIHCVLFSKNAMKIGKMTQLCTQPFQDWRNATKVFKIHGEKSPFHRQCQADANSFMFRYTRGTGIAQQLDGIQNATIAKNRLIMTSLIKIITVIARQGLPLRGKDETDPTAEFQARSKNEDGNNCGNFLAIVKLAVNLECPILKEHLSTCAKNATYLSKTVQNELIYLIAKNI